MSKLPIIPKILIAYLLISLIGCSESTKNPKDIVITASIPPLAYLASEIGGNRIIVKTLLPPGSNMHSFEPNPEAIKDIYNSRLFFSVGKEWNFENVLIKKIGGENIESLIDCSNSVNIIKNDPHYWLSPTNMRKVADLMLNELIGILPYHKLYFTNNKNRFIEKLDSIDIQITSILKTKSDKNIFVYHPAWEYFVRYFGMKQFSIEQEGKAPKAKNLKNIIYLAKERGINCIFFDPHFDNSSVLAIAEELNISVDTLDPLPKDYLANLIDISKKLEKYLR